MRKIVMLLVMFTSGNVWGNKYSEYQSNPNILVGASGSDDTAFIFFYIDIYWKFCCCTFF